MTAEKPLPDYTSGDVARMFSVTVTTVIHWGEEGKLLYRKTLGGNRRYNREYIDELVRMSERYE